MEGWCHERLPERLEEMMALRYLSFLHRKFGSFCRLLKWGFCFFWLVLLVYTYIMYIFCYIFTVFHTCECYVRKENVFDITPFYGYDSKEHSYQSFAFENDSFTSFQTTCLVPGKDADQYVASSSWHFSQGNTATHLLETFFLLGWVAESKCRLYSVISGDKVLETNNHPKSKIWSKIETPNFRFQKRFLQKILQKWYNIQISNTFCLSGNIFVPQKIRLSLNCEVLQVRSSNLEARCRWLERDEMILNNNSFSTSFSWS